MPAVPDTTKDDIYSSADCVICEILGGGFRSASENVDHWIQIS